MPPESRAVRGMPMPPRCHMGSTLTPSDSSRSIELIEWITCRSRGGSEELGGRWEGGSRKYCVHRLPHAERREVTGGRGNGTAAAAAAEKGAVAARVGWRRGGMAAVGRAEPAAPAAPTKKGASDAKVARRRHRHSPAVPRVSKGVSKQASK